MTTSPPPPSPRSSTNLCKHDILIDFDEDDGRKGADEYQALVRGQERRVQQPGTVLYKHNFAMWNNFSGIADSLSSSSSFIPHRKLLVRGVNPNKYNNSPQQRKQTPARFFVSPSCSKPAPRTTTALATLRSDSNSQRRPHSAASTVRCSPSPPNLKLRNLAHALARSNDAGVDDDDDWAPIIATIRRVYSTHDDARVTNSDVATAWYVQSFNEPVTSCSQQSMSGPHTLDIHMSAEYHRFARLHAEHERALRVVPKDNDLATKTLQRRLQHGFLVDSRSSDTGSGHRRSLTGAMEFHAAIIYDADSAHFTRSNIPVAQKRCMIVGVLRTRREHVFLATRHDRSERFASRTTVTPQLLWRDRLHRKMRRQLWSNGRQLREVDASDPPCSDSGDIPMYVPYDGCEFTPTAAVHYATIVCSGAAVPPQCVECMEFSTRFRCPIKDIERRARADPHTLHFVRLAPHERRAVSLQEALTSGPCGTGVISIDVELGSTTSSGPKTQNDAQRLWYRHSVKFSSFHPDMDVV
eukprot:PhM_4_TR12240/c0_g1_i1/m.48794